MTYQVIAGPSYKLGILERDDAGLAVAIYIDGRSYRTDGRTDYRPISVEMGSLAEAKAEMERYLDSLIV